MFARSVAYCPPRLQGRFSCQARVSMTTSTYVWKPNFFPVEGATNDSRAMIRLVSYNILAQAYVKSVFFPHSPSQCLRWKVRSQAILARLLGFEADILCLQEVDNFEDFYKGGLAENGFSSVYVQRNGRKKDGCGIFYQRKRLELIVEEPIHYNDLVPRGDDGDETGATSSSDEESSERGDPNDPRVRFKRDCVGILAAFRILGAPSKLFVLANTHIYWDPDWKDVKLAQAKYLVSRLLNFRGQLETKFKSKIPIIACGDFNSTPGDEVYNYLISGVGTEEKGGQQSDPPPKCPLPLHSLYSFVQGEPAFTNCTPDFTGTLDYIFFSCPNLMQPLSLLEVPSAGSADLSGGLPNFNHPSDHLPIGTDIAILGEL